MNKYENFLKKTILWCSNYFKKNNISNVVIGISGGIDSAVSLAILNMIKGINIHAYFIDIESSKESLIDAEKICNEYNIKLNVVNLENIYKSFLKITNSNSIIQNGNLKVRLRTTYLYDQAFFKKAIVVGNSNYDELFLGYYTKFGDNAVDIMLLNNLLKKDIYNLANYLNIPSSIIKKSPSADLYKNQSDETEIGISYNVIDDFLLGKKISSNEKKKIINFSKVNQHKNNVLKNPYKISDIKN